MPFPFLLSIYRWEVVNMEEVFNLVGNLGFPIAVTLYLLIRIEGKLELLTQSINQLSQTLTEGKAQQSTTGASMFAPVVTVKVSGLVINKSIMAS